MVWYAFLLRKGDEWGPRAASKPWQSAFVDARELFGAQGVVAGGLGCECLQCSGVA
jgi:hypothetical protein